MIEADRTQLSPNSHAGTPSGRLVVVHATRSGVSNNPNELEGTINWFMRRDVGLSTHWVIGRDGTKVRMVEDGRWGVHAGEDNPRSWGIELCQGVEGDGFTEPQLAALVAVCRGYIEDFGVPPTHTRDSGFAGFIGHEESTQGRRDGKSDPGRMFPWVWFIDQLGGLSTPLKYDREQALWALLSLAREYGLKKFEPRASLRRLHPFDQAVIRDIVKELE